MKGLLDWLDGEEKNVLVFYLNLNCDAAWLCFTGLFWWGDGEEEDLVDINVKQNLRFYGEEKVLLTSMVILCKG